MRCYLGVDVGTSSVRAGLFTEEDGKLLSTAVNTISISNHQPDHYEQSTENIWEAVCITVKALNTNGTWLIRGEDTNNFTGTLGNHMALLRLFYPEKQIVGFDYTPPTQPQTKRETSSLEMHLSKFRSSKTGLSDCMHTPEHYYPDTFQYSVLSVGYNGGEISLKEDQNHLCAYHVWLLPFHIHGSVTASTSLDTFTSRILLTPDTCCSDEQDLLVATVPKDAVSRACIRKEDVCGIGFDATCSLVVLDSECHPLSVNASGDSYWNVIMWMDHRAAGQVERINTTNHDVLKFVGGKMSPEMQLPKLLWLKENLKETCWNKAGHFFDLPDFLTWRATGSFSRSLCSLVCKWSYQVYSNKKGSWNDEFFRMANLSDLLADNYAKIGNDVRFPGVPCGSGLSSFGSAALGLCPGTPVGTSIIDAHAGGLGSMACVPTRQVLPELVYRMALICGTSSCHMTVSSDPTFVPGVWGPYFSAMIPGLWLNEGGQSATGKLLDHIVHTHPAFPGLRASAGEKKQHSFEFLNDMLSQLAAQGSVPSLAHLTSNIHVWPDFHGNRSPLADPTLRGMISGMTLSSTVEDLALLYLATVQAVAYGTKHILKEMEKHGYHIQVVCVCGGLRKNPLFVQTHADVTGLPLLLPDTQESVLLGAAILGAYATGNFSSIQSLMKKMGGSGRIVQPIPSDASYHDKKYGVFLKMLAHQREYQNLMKS